MAFLEWTEKLSVGDNVLDEEHKHIMSYINDLHTAIEEDRSVEVLSKILDNVIAYTVYHFRHEQDVFLNTDYPDAALHIKEHEAMTAKIMNIQSKVRYGDQDQISIELLIVLKEWLINHIQGTDVGYVPYVKKKKEELALLKTNRL